MIRLFGDDDVSESTVPAELPQGVIWIDLLNPTTDEIGFVESQAKIRVPSMDSLSEIES